MGLGCIHGKAEACLGMMGKLKKQTLWNSRLYKAVSRKVLLFGEMMKKVLVARISVGWRAMIVGIVKKRRSINYQLL